MLRLFGSSASPRLFVGTVKVVAAITVLSVLAAKYLSEGSLDQGALTRLAAQATGETTGSIMKSANTIKLDPCVKR